MKPYLTIAESVELVEMAVSRETASHIYSKTKNDGYMICAVSPVLQSIPGRNIDYEHPCFSVSDILAILPTSIGMHYLDIMKIEPSQWVASYRNPYTYPPMTKEERADELIDALAALLKWYVSRKKLQI